MAKMEEDLSDRLPRRDYFLLPLLSLSTIAILFAGAETASRFMWAQDEHDICFEKSPAGIYRHRPDCTARMKNAEGPWLEYRYNGCGYRSAAPCGPKPRGTIRIALLGSSTSAGMFVTYEETFATLMGTALSKFCGRPAEVQNLGVAGAPITSVYGRFDEALALKPDLVILPITIFDLESSEGPSPPAKSRLSWYTRLKELTNESRASTVLSHYLFRDGQELLAFYRRLGNRQDLMHAPLSPWWAARFGNVDAAVAGMAEKTRAAGIPFVLTAVPSRTEAALLNADQTTAGVDPMQFGRRISEIAAHHGLPYIDSLDAFRRTPNAASDFYPVDSHLNAAGQRVLATAVIRGLTGGASPPFAACGTGSKTAD